MNSELSLEMEEPLWHPELPSTKYHVAPKDKVLWASSIPFFLVHLVAILALFFTDFNWKNILLAVSSYYLRMFAITAGYHRYFSHRTYKLGRISQFVMGFLGAASAQKGPLWWASQHRHHHRFSDLPEDIHSPLQKGFWASHVRWILTDSNINTRWSLIKDLSRYPELRLLDRFYFIPPTLYAIAFFLAGGWQALMWGFFISTVFLWHGTFSINSLAHVWGKRVYHTTDTSRNNFFLSLVTLGEGWHNNHHCYMNSANQGFHWWQIDISFYVLKGLSWLGIVKDIKKAPLAQLESRKIKQHD